MIWYCYICFECSVAVIFYYFSFELPLCVAVVWFRQIHEICGFLLLWCSGSGSLFIRYCLISALLAWAYIEYTTTTTITVIIIIITIIKTTTTTTTTVITVGPNVWRKPLEADDGGHCEQHRAVRGTGRCRYGFWQVSCPCSTDRPTINWEFRTVRNMYQVITI